jgi:hypothetical protein
MFDGASNNGGAISIDEAELVLVDVIMQKNEGFREGGAMHIFGGSIVHIYDSTITENFLQTDDGGAFYVNDADLSLENSIISKNSAYAGGGFFISSNSIVTLKNCIVENNTAIGGGGFYVAGGFLEVSYSEVLGNIANGRDGAGFYMSSGDAIFENSIFADNRAISATFTIASGGCTVNAGCFYSSNFPDNYNNKETCSIVPSATGSLAIGFFFHRKRQ